MKSLLRSSAFVSAAALLLVTSTALATPSTPDFIKNAAVGGMFEVQSSQLASQNAASPAVKQFAQKMIADHTKANNELKTIVASDPSLPAPPTTLDSSHQKMLDKLSKESGEDFDKDYVKGQTKAHDKTVDLFQKYADKGDNAALKNFAGQTLPDLQDHKMQIKQIKSSM